MENVSLYNPKSSLSLTSLSSRRLLELSRPTSHCKFVRQGDTIHLLVYLNSDCETPFLRIPVDSLYSSAQRFVAHEQFS